MLRLGDPESGGIGRGALALPGEGSHADPLLGRRSLRLGGEEGRGESGVGGGLHARCDSSAVGHGDGGGILQHLRRGPQGSRIDARGLQ